MRMDGLLKTGCGSANPERDNGKDQRTKGGRGLVLLPARSSFWLNQPTRGTQRGHRNPGEMSCYG